MNILYYTRVIISCILSLLFCDSSFSQVNQDWVARYNGPGDSSDRSFSIAVDGSGNVYVTGNSYGNGTNFDYLTIKYNPAGFQQWTQRYNGSANSLDGAYSIAVDTAGNIYVTGFSSVINQQLNYVTIKYNPAGEQQWAADYNGLGNSYDNATSIAIDSSGNVYVTGSSYGNGTQMDYVTIKYTSSGDSVWVKRYNGTGNSNDNAISIAVDISGNVYVTGNSYGSGSNPDYATIKYNSAGEEQWVARYNGPGNGSEQSDQIALDYSGNVYVTGYSYGSGTNNDYVTIKYNSNGIQQWVSRYNGTGNGFDYANSLAVDSAGNAYVTGDIMNSSGSRDYATLKYNKDGIQQWAAIYSGPADFSDDYAYSIALDDLGNVYVTGGSQGEQNNQDYTTIKYNSSGILLWEKRYSEPGSRNEYATSIVLDKTGAVYVTGSSTGSGSDLDYATIKYSQSTGISQISSVIPDQFSLSQNYPNPFNPVTNLEFGISDLGFVSLKVYDVLGKEVVTLVKEKLNPGNYKVEFDGSGLTSGVYFYRLTAGEFTETKRMMLLK